MAEEKNPEEKGRTGLFNLVPFADVLKNLDIVFAIGLLCVVLMMVVPLPVFLIDIMLAMNIAIGMTILLISIYTKDALDFSVFPSLLLVTTLFRLGLNISSTRVILLGRGSEIKLIEAFGNFVVGGNYIVGIVIYAILATIQFMVITKGAERVAEVAARFTLDAMPGKQMAIDADLNAGLIDNDEAKTRRKKVQQEADFYGAMDGAVKFVSGDAVAGIIIIFVNVLGGLGIGVFQRGESFIDAAQTYILFSIGDGLAAQIPALLISTATGAIVTRAGTESNLGTQIASQVFNRPKILSLASGMLLVLGLIPGLPKISFFILSVLFGSLAYITHTSETEGVKAAEEAKKQEEATGPPKPEDVSSLLSVDPLEIEIGYNLIPLVDSSQGGDLLNRITLIRRQMALDLGLVVPPIRIRDNIQLSPSCYVVKIKGVEMAKYEVIPDQLLAMNPGTVSSTVSGIDVQEPAFGLPAVWIQQSMRERAEMSGYTVVDPSTVVATHLTEVIRQNCHEILGRQELQSLLDSVKQTYPLIVEEIVPKVVTIPVLLRILQNLLREGVSIRNMVTILEAVADCPGVTDPDTLTEVVRQSLSRHICKALSDEQGAINVISLDPHLEQILSSSLQKVEGTVQLGLDPNTAQRFLANLKDRIEEVSQEGKTPILLCASPLRLSIKRLTERMAPRLVVLGYNEIPNNISLQSIGVVSIQ